MTITPEHPDGYARLGVLTYSRQMRALMRRTPVTAYAVSHTRRRSGVVIAARRGGAVAGRLAMI
jgi:hypothetical protein